MDFDLPKGKLASLNTSNLKETYKEEALLKKREEAERKVEILQVDTTM